MNYGNPLNPSTCEGRMLRALMEHSELSTMDVIRIAGVCNPHSAKCGVNQFAEAHNHEFRVECEARKVGGQRLYFYRLVGQLPTELAEAV